jgi:hypothetical protein
MGRRRRIDARRLAVSRRDVVGDGCAPSPCAHVRLVRRRLPKYVLETCSDCKSARFKRRGEEERFGPWTNQLELAAMLASAREAEAAAMSQYQEPAALGAGQTGEGKPTDVCALAPASAPVQHHETKNVPVETVPDRETQASAPHESGLVGPHETAVMNASALAISSSASGFE